MISVIWRGGSGKIGNYFFPEKASLIFFPGEGAPIFYFPGKGILIFFLERGPHKVFSLDFLQPPIINGCPLSRLLVDILEFMELVTY